MTSIDMNAAKEILSEILKRDIDKINLDIISEIWEIWDVIPQYEGFESGKLSVRCILHYETHKFYSDIRVVSERWNSYLLASLDAVLQLRHAIKTEKYKDKQG